MQNEERVGLALSVATHSGWLLPLRGVRRERRYAMEVRGFLCHSLAHCSYASARVFSFWYVAERTFLVSSCAANNCAHSCCALNRAWQ